jgi:CheY-like chemotaxis protein
MQANSDGSASKRILLVEDEALVQMVACDHLEDLGFQPEAAGTATEALSKLKQMNGDVAAAIVDVGLPDRRGDVLVGEIRAIYPGMAIIIASGYGEGEFRKRFGSDRRIGFLSKPYQGSQLRAVLSSLDVSPHRSGST